MHPQEIRTSQCVIIGSGPAGYTAAIYAARAMLKPILIAGVQPGGQLTITTDVENYPGFAEPIQGPWLMDQMQRQAEHVGAQLITDTVVSADLSKRPFRLELDSGVVVLANTLIIATGAQAQWLGIESEAKYQGFGVSACATCDGFFYRGKDVIVVGGGNTAVEEALFLTAFASKVTLVHRRDELRAEKILQDRLFANSKVHLAMDSVVEEVLGSDEPFGVTGALLRNVKTGELCQLNAHGLFVAIGHTPASRLFAGQIPLDDNGYIKVRPGSSETDVQGVFAAGDVTDHVYRQAVTAAGMGCMAALDAVRLLGEENNRAAFEASIQPLSAGHERIMMV